MFRAMGLAATRMPPDVRHALERAYAEETEPLARQHLLVSMDNAALAERGEGLVCADTGYPMFLVQAGARTCVEGGFGSVTECAARATARATAECLLRPTMVDPITRENPGDNLGGGMPKVELVFKGEGEGLEVIAAPKGGGSEIFGTFYRMLFPSDGLAGVKKFVIECLRDACYAGKICPPAIIGVGVGGTADLCMALAKKAALLRRVGSFNPDPDLAALEHELMQAARGLGLGPMGARGINAAMAIHIATGFTHTAALPVAFNAQCLVGRRWKAILDASGNTTYTGEIG